MVVRREPSRTLALGVTAVLLSAVGAVWWLSLTTNVPSSEATLQSAQLAVNPPTPQAPSREEESAAVPAATVPEKAHHRTSSTKPHKSYFLQEPRAQCSRKSSKIPTVSHTTPIDVLRQVDCPPFKLNEDNEDKQEDRRSSWVVAKYKYYASRCNRTAGVMWSQLTKRAHDRVVDRVLELYGLPVQPSEPHPPLVGHSLLNRPLVQGSSLALLDWACGCGVTLDYMDARVGSLLQTSNTSQQTSSFVGIGIDLTAGAIAYAQSTYMSETALRRRQAEGRTVRFCHADGTDLAWLPPASFDIITAFGGLLHLPTKYMCSTLHRLISLLKPETGMLWAGYIDNAETRSLLTSCSFDCAVGEEVVVSVLDENRWWKGVGIPQANKKRKPVSVVWERKQQQQRV